MRDIKFRAWDLYNEKMFNSLSMNFQNSSLMSIFDLPNDEIEDLELIQYTGLKDKNDVEIYEGDIVSFTLFDCFDNDIQHIGKILFNNGAFYIEYMDKCELYNSLLCYVISQDDEFEVIGNIYENQELLN